MQRGNGIAVTNPSVRPSFLGAVDVSANYWVLGTDYENYAVVWGCFGVGTTLRAESAWILSRTPQLSAASLAQVQPFVDQFLDEENLRTTIQDAQL